MKGTSLAGTVALVTGADAALGEITAVRLAREGAAVALTGHRLEDVARAIGRIVEIGRVAYAVGGDLTDAAQAVAAVETTLDRFGRLDILVNAMNLRLLGSALHATVEDWDAMLISNIGATLHVTHAAIPYLIAAASTSTRGTADIVNVGATDRCAVAPETSVYRLTQVALDGFAESLRHELAIEHVRVGTVLADHWHTEVLRRAAAGPSAAFGRSLVDHLGHLVEPSSGDVADAVVYVVTRPSRVAVGHVRVHTTRPAN